MRRLSVREVAFIRDGGEGERICRQN